MMCMYRIFGGHEVRAKSPENLWASPFKKNGYIDDSLSQVHLECDSPFKTFDYRNKLNLYHILNSSQ
jgi:hypothetical protein